MAEGRAVTMLGAGLRIAITGAMGLLGGALIALLAQCAHPIYRALAPHRRKVVGPIGGTDGRQLRYNLHAAEDCGGVGLRACEAGDLWLARERARQRRACGA